MADLNENQGEVLQEVRIRVRTKHGEGDWLLKPGDILTPIDSKRLIIDTHDGEQYEVYRGG